MADRGTAGPCERRAVLHLVHVELADANAFVDLLHRHHTPIQGHRFSLGAQDDTGKLRGVAIVGRPVGGQHQRDWLEVTRLCTDGTSNACSFLYGAAARAGRALGYLRIQTYILAEEPGVSLKAAGWQFERMSHPVGWYHGPAAGAAAGAGARAARVVDPRLMERKQLWFRELR